MRSSAKDEVLARLRQHIARVEGGAAGRSITITPAGSAPAAAGEAAAASPHEIERTGDPASAAVRLGAAEIDRRLPGGGLQRGRLHEVIGAIEGAGTGFAVHVLRRLLAGDAAGADGGPVLWCAPRCSLHAPGLAARGLNVDRLVVVTAPRREDRLWAMEESLRVSGVLAVVGELQGRETVDLTASRRLQLAAGQGGGLALLLRPPPPGTRPVAVEETDDGGGAEAGPVPGASAAVTRWHVQTVAAADGSRGGDLGLRSRWRLALVRSRTGARHCWIVEVDHATGDLAVASPLRDRSGTARRAAG
jgi:protein ImuA